MSFEAYESPGGNLVAYHSSFLTANSQVECLNAICRSLSDTTEILIIPAVVNSSDTEDAILDFCRNSNWKILRYDGTTSPYLTIGETWDNYLAGKSSNFRYTLRRKERGLAKKGDLSEKWFKTAECISELRETILLIESRSWKVSAHMAISDSPVERAYYDRLLPFLADNNALAANVLYVDRTPVAYSLCSVWNNRFAQLKTSFIEDFAALSPGLTANHHAIRHAFESGANEFDFLGDIMQHKTNWTDEVRRHTNYYLLAPSARASIVHCLKSVAQTVKGFRGRKPTIGRSGQTRR
jgi:CelD/BcsL family acetyltransferase involved in cellulose biosynthesis